MSSKHPAYQVFMLVLCVYALGAFVVQSVASIGPEARHIIEYADVGVCAIFLVDFGYHLATEKHRWAYMSRWGWLDLVSSIPMIPALRIGRAARVVRVLRVLRGVRSSRLLAGMLLERRAESAFLAASMLTILLLVFSSVAVLQFESVGNIRTAGDALWWATVTLTTVGYGDHYPVTAEGRIIAIALMFGGVALIGTLSGFAASWFLRPAERQLQSVMSANEEISKLRSEVSDLRRELRELIGKSRDIDDSL